MTIFNVGQSVSTKHWNRYTPDKLPDPSIIVGLKNSNGCQSGLLVNIDSYPAWLDSDWFNNSKQPD